LHKGFLPKNHHYKLFELILSTDLTLLVLPPVILDEQDYLLKGHAQENIGHLHII